MASNVIGPDAGQWWQRYFLRTSLYNRGFSTLYAVPPRNQSSRYQVLSTDISTGSPLQELPTITWRKPFLQHYSHFQGHPLYNIVDQCKAIKGHATGKGPSPLLSYWSICLRLLWCIITQLLPLLKISFLSFIYMLILKVNPKSPPINVLHANLPLLLGNLTCHCWVFSCLISNCVVSKPSSLTLLDIFVTLYF